jgi:hypothetical protein
MFIYGLTNLLLEWQVILKLDAVRTPEYQYLTTASTVPMLYVFLF